MANNVDLDDFPYYDVSSCELIEVFINGKSRGSFFPSKKSHLYVVMIPDSSFDSDDLPF